MSANQIINLNGFNLGASSSDSGPSPTTAPPALPANNSIILSNQNQSNSNHSALTQASMQAAHLIQNTNNASSPNNANANTNDNGHGDGGSDSSNGGDNITITRPDQILAIFPTSQQSQLLNINHSFNANNANAMSNSILHHPDHLNNVDNNSNNSSSSSNCSFNRCNNNSSLSSANNNTDNTRIPHSNCSNNMQTFNSFIDSTTHLNRNTRPSNPNNCVSDV